MSVPDPMRTLADQICYYARRLAVIFTSDAVAANCSDPKRTFAQLQPSCSQSADFTPVLRLQRAGASICT
jgi:hypothetical protein